MVCLTGARPIFMMGESVEDSVMECTDGAPGLALPVCPPQFSPGHLGLFDVNQNEDRYVVLTCRGGGRVTERGCVCFCKCQQTRAHTPGLTSLKLGLTSTEDILGLIDMPKRSSIKICLKWVHYWGNAMDKSTVR